MMRYAPVSRLAMLAALALGLSACAETNLAMHAAKSVTADSPERGVYKVGKPYQIRGVWYYPAEDWEYDETGIASWYGPDFHGKATANGDVFDQNDITAAHRTLPMPSIVRVTNLENGRSLVVRVNDRGPFAHGRIIDLSRRSAQLLGFEAKGTAKVRVQVLPEESRALANRMMNNSPEQSQMPAASAAPREAVVAESLPPPGSDQPKVLVSAPQARPAATLELAKPDQTVKLVGVPPTSIFVQAGSFSRPDNASRVSSMLSGIGNAQVTPVRVGSNQFYRVRMGPLTSVEQADSLLEQVIGAGYPDAKIVVD